MSVQLNPSNALGFRRPLTSLVKRSLTITNNNAQPVAFKVKTTAPKLYCVRPNSGRVEPGESVDVSVMLQALKEEPPLNTKCKDKFLIQSTLITPDKETLPLADIWASPETNEEGKVFQQKLRVTYLPAEGQVLEEEDENPQVGMTSVMSVNDSHYDTVRQPGANGHQPLDSQFLAGATQFHHAEDRTHTPSNDLLEHQSSQEAGTSHAVPTIVESTIHEEPPRELTPPPPPMPAPFAPAPVVERQRVPEPSTQSPVHHEPIPPVPPVAVAPPPQPPVVQPEPIIITRENPINEELYAKYNQALAEVDHLQATVNGLATKLKQAEERQAPPVSELRKRSRRLSDADSAAGSDAMTMVEDSPMHQEGVPLNVVVIIAVGVFVTTYLFF
ncbi:PapD-like protein [Crepidotus variabilis]|uniref:PapD-like protein n=1 Tax=Crepidotus variabilis TaxID=179855 RepID=A0A9P6ENQ7_9AGAR|nr:PapD-like protein [Crepidotus variabilis]